ncbi:MAG: hypothetical protein ACR2M0_07805 [Chloroflexia bacterium]
MAEAIYHGVVRGNVVVLAEGVHLDDGLRVEVRAPAPEVEAQQAAEDLLKQKLMESGLVKEFRNPPYPPTGDRIPIHVKGKPLSETIIEDRR